MTVALRSKLQGKQLKEKVNKTSTPLLIHAHACTRGSENLLWPIHYLIIPLNVKILPLC